MGDRPLRVLIVATRGAHLVAIRTVCAAIPQVQAIDATHGATQALAMIQENPPDLAILGANLPAAGVAQFLDGLRELERPPFSVLLTLSESEQPYHSPTTTGCVIPIQSFAERLPGVISGVE